MNGTIFLIPFLLYLLLAYERDINFLLSLYPTTWFILSAFRVRVFIDSLESLFYRITQCLNEDTTFFDVYSPFPFPRGKFSST